MKKSLYIFFLICTILMIAGCATTSKQTSEEDSQYPTTLGNFSPFKLGDAISLWKNGDDVSPCEMELFCVPRTNKIEIYFCSSIDKVCLMMDAKDCATFDENLMKYMNDYNEGNFDKNHKPKKDNSYGVMETSVSWGVFGYGSYNADIKVRFNYEIIGGKPYFSMSMEQGLAKGQTDIYSPKMTMYFSPSQLETIKEITDPEIIMAHIKELETEAYEFNYQF